MKNGFDHSHRAPHICVYCGSRSGLNPDFPRAAHDMGQRFARQGYRLVYGGGGVGLMGEVANGCLENGGHVTGIIPDFLLEKEDVLNEVSELIITQTMNERKQIMYDRSDAFIALPGGIGTVDEIVEMMTLSKLHQHDKPIILVSLDNYWDSFIDLMKHMQAQDFIDARYTPEYIVVDSVAAAMSAIARHLNKGKTGADAAAYPADHGTRPQA